jgi:hypothetical protein
MLSEKKKTKLIILIATDIMTLSLPIAVFSRDFMPLNLKLILLGAGYTWAAIIACSVPLAVCFEPLRIGLKFLAPDLKIPKEKIFALLCCGCIIMVAGGYISATSPVVKEVHYDFSNGTGTAKEYDIAAVSDFHAGELMTRKTVAKMVEAINKTTPDLIILAGDTLDSRDCVPSGALKELAKLSAPLGKYAVLGNHEYYIGADWSVARLREQGINILRDNSTVIDNRLLLVGRDDFAGLRFNSTRSPLVDILKKAPKLPTIVIDHTPRELEEAADCGVKLQFSGHTHNGQLFPFNYLVDKIFENSFGELIKKQTIFFVSSGIGFWGPPLRTNSRSQIILMRITL